MSGQNRKKRIVAGLWSVVLTIALVLGGMPCGMFAGRTMAADGSVHIRDLEGFLKFAKACKEEDYSVDLVVSLESDIDLTKLPEGEEFHGITSFSGCFCGNFHTISGLSLSEGSEAVGLFGYVEQGAKIKDLRVKGTIDCSTGKASAGGIAGINAGTIQGCYFKGTVSNLGETGGIAGKNGGTGVINRCVNSGAVDGLHKVGGIVGENRGTVKDCSNACMVNADTKWLDFEGDEELSLSATGVWSSFQEKIGEGTDFGGIAGWNNGLIADCSNKAVIGYQHAGRNIGGIVGCQKGQVLRCVNTGRVYGKQDVGGIVGQFEPKLRKEDVEELGEQAKELHDRVERMISDLEKMGKDLHEDFRAITQKARETEKTMNALLTELRQVVEKNVDNANELASRIDYCETHFQSSMNYLEQATKQEEQLIGDLERIQDELNHRAQPEAEKIKEDVKSEAEKAKEEAQAEAEKAKEKAKEEAQAEAEKAKEKAKEEAQAEAEKAKEKAKEEAQAEAEKAKEKAKEEVQAEAEKAKEKAKEEAQAEAEKAKEKAKEEVQVEAEKAKEKAKEEAQAEAEKAKEKAKEEVQESGNQAEQEKKDKLEEIAQDLRNNGDQVAEKLKNDLRDRIGRPEPDMNDADDPAKISDEEDLEEIKETAEDAWDVLSKDAHAMSASLQAAGKEWKNIADYLNAQESIRAVNLSSNFDRNSEKLDAELGELMDLLDTLEQHSYQHSETLEKDMRAINDQANNVLSVMVVRLDNMQAMANGEDIIIDLSSLENVVKDGTEVSECTNKGVIHGDRNVGGIAGTMGVEKTDTTQGKNLSVGRRYMAGAVLHDCEDQGFVNVKTENAGGIVGSQELGLISGCIARGRVQGTEADDLGGIAGRSSGRIVSCGSLAVLNGANEIGGIAGQAKSVQDCHSMVTITGSKEWVGAVVGRQEFDEDEEDATILRRLAKEKMSGNYYCSSSLYGINGVSSSGVAQSVTYQELLALDNVPEAFSELTVTFIDTDQNLIDRITLPYGYDLAQLAYPEVKTESGEYMEWSGLQGEKLEGNLILQTREMDLVTILSGDLVQKNKSVVLAEGNFTERAKVHAEDYVGKLPDNLPANCICHCYKVVLENATLDVGDVTRVRLLCEEEGETTIYRLDGDRWTKLGTKRIGSYEEAQMFGTQAIFCICTVEKKLSVYLLIIMGSCVTIVLTLLGILLGRKRRRQKSRLN